MRKRIRVACILAQVALGTLCVANAGSPSADLAALVGQPADIAPSAYSFRADRPPDQNPPEGWILLLQYANLPFEKPVDPNSPAFQRVLGGLLWEEVRPVRSVELSWPADARSRPSPDEITLSYFDSTDGTAHTWWNPRSIKEAGRPSISPDGRTFTYSIPVDTWGVVATLRGTKPRATVDCPAFRALVPDTWKRLDIEIEWGFDKATTELDHDGAIASYDGRIGDLRPLAGDTGTVMTGPDSWTSARKSQGRRGLRLSVLYMGSSRWRRVWPYHAQPDDVARTIVTIKTRSGGFSFLVSDLEQGPILAPEFGFFVRAIGRPEAGARPANTLPRLSARALTDKLDAIEGVPRVRGWTRAGTPWPWFGANPSREPGTAGSLTVPAQSAAMHPAPDEDVAVGWRSPIKGRVRLKGKLAMGDANGGNGIEWLFGR